MLAFLGCLGNGPQPRDKSPAEAEYAGEELSRFTILITYCPFCGMNLTDALTESEYANPLASAWISDKKGFLIGHSEA
ncbi:MAG TPA: hypothetical protein ENK58_06750 [Desulfobacterales bacterium]|nr:hypothetical protein [Desulfobacterales bacterium]